MYITGINVSRILWIRYLLLIPFYKYSDSSKRTTYLDWDEYFMAIAFLSAKRSKDPSTQVGACIVNNDKKIVGIGYNGMPTGCSDDEFPWKRGPHTSLDAKYLYGIMNNCSFFLNI